MILRHYVCSLSRFWVGRETSGGCSHKVSLMKICVVDVSIRFLSLLKCFFQLSIMFKPGTSRPFISFVPMHFLWMSLFLIVESWSYWTQPLFYYYIARLYLSYYSSSGSLYQWSSLLVITITSLLKRLRIATVDTNGVNRIESLYIMLRAQAPPSLPVFFKLGIKWLYNSSSSTLY